MGAWQPRIKKKKKKKPRHLLGGVKVTLMYKGSSVFSLKRNTLHVTFTSTFLMEQYTPSEAYNQTIVPARNIDLEFAHTVTFASLPFATWMLTPGVVLTSVKVLHMSVLGCSSVHFLSLKVGIVAEQLRWKFDSVVRSHSILQLADGSDISVHTVSLEYAIIMKLIAVLVTKLHW